MVNASITVPADTIVMAAAEGARNMTLRHTLVVQIVAQLKERLNAVWLQPSLLDAGVGLRIAPAIRDSVSGAHYDLDSLEVRPSRLNGTSGSD